MANPQQLSLGVSLNDDATFDNFYAPEGSSNAATLELLKAQAEGRGEWFIYVWGRSGVGLTHLLQAAGHRAQDAGQAIQYLPLREVVGFAPEALLEGLDQLDYLCLDGLEAIAGKPDWEEALFHLFNRMRDAGGRLLAAAVQGPRELPIELPDLHSRLQWGMTCQVHPLSDDEKQLALRHRARARGLELNEEVAHYILQRVPRDMNELFCYLQRLDHASLAEQRKLTIPFVKKVLSL
ncbi:DnaA regulatory inactivator Hda [Marinimicrobium agarilyticum]|uniref:DnaA regulatory inactivator Hda n=1 Tax=Marinimicrobium agarilyticum TaxID=306546 RepID=UPI00041CE01F|nr:DnaA regulatory inactivator Hda [Marinimicrobium agarilyticum]